MAKYVSNGTEYSSATVMNMVRHADKPCIVADTSGGPHSGNVYLALDGSINGRLTLVFTRSTDGGRAFSDPILLSQEDGILAGLAIDLTGSLYVSSPGPGFSNRHILNREF